MMAQWLKTPTALVKNPSSVPSTHSGQLTTGYNWNLRGFSMPLFYTDKCAHMHRQTDRHINTHTLY